ncbi:MAG: protein kinase, partial [Pirellulaceae bacterium]|nr:protein kinase [Pirellulaceae bacterium]
MIQSAHCPECRRPLPADAPHGVCPHCVLDLGLSNDPSLVATTEPAGSSASASLKPNMAPRIDELAAHFPQLEILDLIGVGGMGSVYKAKQVGLDRIVALKVLAPHLGEETAFAERFNREARAMARMSHPNIVTVYDHGEVDGFYYLVMEYIDGVNLREILNTGAIQADEALRYVPQICEALQYAHDENIVHRDIKPENILVDRRGRVKIADFGLAKLLLRSRDDLTLTGTRQVMGTLHYMAPEQVEKPTAVDHRADIYSLGVVFYEMLTGELPIGRFAAPSDKAPVQTRFDDVVFRTLEKDPDRRYQRAGEMKQAVERLSSDSVYAAQPLPAKEPPVVNRPRSRPPSPLRVPVSLYNANGAETDGILRFDGKVLLLEYLEKHIIPGMKPKLNPVEIPLDHLVRLEVIEGLATLKLNVQTDLLAEDTRFSQRGMWTTKVKAADEPEARRLVTAVLEAEPQLTVSSRIDEAARAVKFLNTIDVGYFVIACIDFVCALALLVASVLAFFSRSHDGPVAGAWFLVFSLLSFSYVVLMALTGASLRKTSRYGFAMSGAIAGFFPLHIGVVAAIPFGVLALVLLQRGPIRAAFDADSAEREVADDRADSAAAARDVGTVAALFFYGVALLDGAGALAIGCVVCGLASADHIRHSGFGEAVLVWLVAVHVAQTLLFSLAALRARRFEARAFVLTATGAMLLPVHIGFVVGVPIAIYSLAVLGRRRVIDAFQQTRSPRNAPGNGKDPGDVAAAISARRRTRLAGSALLVAAAVNVVAGIGVGGWISLIVRHDMFAYCVAIGAWLGFAGL